MKHIAIYPPNVKKIVEVCPPPSKSHTMRALLFASFGKKKSMISNGLISNDTKAMMEALRALGATIEKKGKEIEIDPIPPNLHREVMIDAQNSGIILRFVPAMSCLGQTKLIITGDASIQNLRTIDPLVLAIRQLNGDCTYLKKKGFAPVQIQGPIQAGVVKMDGQDSQPVSAMLSACSYLRQKTTIHVNNPQEKPWIDLTLFWLRSLGAKITNQDYKIYQIEKGVQYDQITYQVPSDFSSASFIVGAALACNTQARLKPLDFTDIQGDKIFVDYLIQMGANLKKDQKNQTLFIEKSSCLQGGIFDMDHCIDALPILAVLGCFMKNKLTLLNCEMARKKESDRMEVMTRELRKMGAKIRSFPGKMEIFPSRLQAARVRSYHDHRIAMALSVAALNAKSGYTIIEDVECVDKTYPQFFQDLQKFGTQIQWIKTSL